jgi:uncharacterized protein YbjQ (UPF0145 family)
MPTSDPAHTTRSAVKSLVRTFFDDSAGVAVAAMLGMYEKNLTKDDLDAIEEVIERARRKGGQK